MKKMKNFIGIIVFMAAGGILFTACPNGDNGVVFSAQTHSEGVKLIINLTHLPAGTVFIDFFVDGFYLGKNIRIWEWEEEGRPYYGKNKIEIIYPFLEPGNTYDFSMQLRNNTWNIIDEPTVTVKSGGGLGRLMVTNNPILSYNSVTKTLSVSPKPNLPEFVKDDKLTHIRWYWGIGTDNDWIGYIYYNNYQDSITFDEDFFSNIQSGGFHKYFDEYYDDYRIFYSDNNLNHYYYFSELLLNIVNEDVWINLSLELKYRNEWYNFHIKESQFVMF